MAWALRTYLGASYLAAPLWRLALRRRVARGKEDPARLGERYGRTTIPRPPGPLLWVHALGIGEAGAMLAVIRALRSERPDVAVLLTTNTRTAAEGLARMGLPKGVVHQYAPVDTPGAVSRFLAQWRPDLLLLAELDLWPLMLSRLRRQSVPVIMANARLTDHRFAGRRKMRALMGDVLGLLDRMLVQNDQTRDRLITLGADPQRIQIAGLLKAAAEPLPDSDHRAALAQHIGARPVWLAAAIEAREIPVLIAAHARARKARPGLLMIMAPRQLTDADAAETALTQAFGACPRRSTGAVPGPQDAVYLADTMGEMGLWYRLSPLSFIGHSLAVNGGRPLTGKNPFEAVALGSVVLHGPCTGNFAESYAALDAAGALVPVADAQTIAAEILDLIQTPARREGLAGAGAQVLQQAAAALPLTVQAVLDRLPPSAHDDALRPMDRGHTLGQNGSEG